MDGYLPGQEPVDMPVTPGTVHSKTWKRYCYQVSGGIDMTAGSLNQALILAVPGMLVSKETCYHGGLKTATIEEAVSLIKAAGYSSGIEVIPIDMADGRVLAEQISARADIPGFSRSLMDGYACRSVDIADANPENPVHLRIMGRIPMGRTDRPALLPGETWAVSTGSLLPEGADTVIMNEEAWVTESDILVQSPLLPGNHIIRKGDDFREGEVIFSAGWTIRPQDIGVLAAAGQIQVPVWVRPRVGIISTGTELVSAYMEPAEGEVREVNSHLISTFLRRQGAEPMMYGIIRDDPDILRKTLLRAAHDCDMVVVSGGSARGERDITKQAISDLGDQDQPCIILGPGKPTIIRFIQGTPVIGLPGHPVSSFLILTLVLTQLIQGLKGSPCQRRYRQIVTMGEDIMIKPGKEHFHLVRIQDGYATTVGGVPGLLSTLLQSDGIIRIPAGTEKISRGDLVEVIVWQ